MSFFHKVIKVENGYKSFIFGIPYGSLLYKVGYLERKKFFYVLKKNDFGEYFKYYIFGISIFYREKQKKKKLKKTISFDKKKYISLKLEYANLINEIIDEIKASPDRKFVVPKKREKLVDYSQKIGYLDPLGCILEKQGKIYRGIYNESVEGFKKLYKSGIIQTLSKYGLLVKTRVTGYYTEDYPIIIEHEKLDYISPHFWTFSQFKDAALNQIVILKVLEAFGYSLIDGHSKNTSFKNYKAQWIDIGSIIVSESVNKFSCKELLQTQLYTLMMRRVNSSLQYRCSILYDYPSLCGEPDFIQSTEYKGIFDEFCILCDKKIRDILKRIQIFDIRPEDVALIFDFKEKNTMWSVYNKWGPEDINKDNRFSKTALLLKNYSPDAKSCTDLAGNSGCMSAYLAENSKIKKFFSIDYDESAVEYGMKMAKSLGININFGLLNFMKPFRESAYDEFKADVVLAMAVTHHLILTQHYNIDAIFEVIGKYTNKYVYIEFCPLGMYGGGDFLPPLPAFYNEDWFQKHFKKFFSILHREVTATAVVNGRKLNHRILYIGKLKGNLS